MRGSQTLFAEIFEAPPAPKQRKGRSATLISKRNSLLIDRYYYYGRVFEYSYPKVLSLLEEEMFLSMITIPEVITDNLDALSELKRNFKDEKPEKLIQHFKKKWPYLIW